MELLQYVQHINSLTPKRGDILLVKLSENVTAEQADNLGSFLEDHYKKLGVNDIGVVLTRDGIEVEVVRKEE